MASSRFGLRRKTAGALAIFLGVLFLAVSAFIAPASAAETVTSSNPSECPGGGLKIEGINDGDYLDGPYSLGDDFTITISDAEGSNGNLSFHWVATEVPEGKVVIAVKVKGGSTKSGGGTQTFPGGESGDVTFTLNHWYSHVSFCLGTAGTTPDQVTAGVTFTEPTCENANTASWTGDNTDEVEYTVTGTVAPGQHVTITAEPIDDNAVIVGQDEWEHTFAAAATNCDELDEITAGVTFTEPTCASPTAGWSGTNTDEINYAVTSGTVAPGQSVTITATLKDGVDKTLTGQTVFNHTFAAAPTNCGGGNPPPPPPGGSVGSTATVDLCPNIAGDQATVPAGMSLVNGACVPSDVCLNLEGAQASVPAGLELNPATGECAAGEVLGEVIEVPVAAPAEAEVIAAPAEAELPRTGSPTMLLAQIGAALVAIGLAIQFLGRKREAAEIR